MLWYIDRRIVDEIINVAGHLYKPIAQDFASLVSTHGIGAELAIKPDAILSKYRRVFLGKKAHGLLENVRHQLKSICLRGFIAALIRRNSLARNANFIGQIDLRE